MKKILSIFILISFITIRVFSQEPVLYQRDSELPIKNVDVKNVQALDLSKQQKIQLKKYNKYYSAKKAAIYNNAALTEQQKKVQMTQLKNEEQEKLQVILTPEQKEKMKQMKKGQPRRGVTNMPNERTAK
jgi:hypothetical protein